MLEKLTKLGFTEKEAKVYLVLLRNGPALASTLACRTGLKRVSVYSVLDALIARGLISFEITQVGRRYLPHDPQCLLYDIEQERAQLQLKWELARDCVKTLSRPMPAQTLDARRVIFLKGLQQIKTEITEFIDPKQKVFGLFAAIVKNTEEQFFKDFFSRDIYKNAIFLTPTVLLSWFAPYAKNNLYFVPHDSPAEQGHILIQNQTVCFLTQREELELMLIRDPDYSKTVFQVLIEPYCKTSGVLAKTSTISSLKG